MTEKLFLLYTPNPVQSSDVLEMCAVLGVRSFYIYNYHQVYLLHGAS
jgi:hypothetical protein